jgi:hypothetical protein
MLAIGSCTNCVWSFRIARFLNEVRSPAGPGASRFPDCNSTLLRAGLRPGNVENVQVFPTKYNQMVHAVFEEQLQNEYSEYAQDWPFARIALFSDGRPARNTCACFQMLVF